MTRNNLLAADKRQLQKLIDRTAAAVMDAHNAEAKLIEWCEARYGCGPGDVDADQIIDAVLGGCCVASGMRAEDFDAVMREASEGRS